MKTDLNSSLCPFENDCIHYFTIRSKGCDCVMFGILIGSGVGLVWMKLKCEKVDFK
jgi:hypothetical protein